MMIAPRPIPTSFHQIAPALSARAGMTGGGRQCRASRHRCLVSSHAAPKREFFIMRNPYSQEERLATMIAATFRASRAHFNHLSTAEIIKPPVGMFDAKLARQIAIHILVYEFDIPRRRVTVLLGVGRAMVLQSIRTVDTRRLQPVFERAYERIAERAKENFMTAIAEDAEAA